MRRKAALRSFWSYQVGTHQAREQIDDNGIRRRRLIQQMRAEHDVGGIILVVNRPGDGVAQRVFGLGCARETCVVSSSAARGERREGRKTTSTARARNTYAQAGGTGPRRTRAGRGWMRTCLFLGPSLSRDGGTNAMLCGDTIWIDVSVGVVYTFVPTSTFDGVAG